MTDGVALTEEPRRPAGSDDRRGSDDRWVPMTDGAPSPRAHLLKRLRAGFTAAPSYEPGAEDDRAARILGLELPVRASIAIAVVVLALLFDFSRTAIPAEIQAIGRAAAAQRYQALERVILFGLVPLLVVVLAFRDRPSRYGLRLGDWRWGLGLAVIGCLVMTPIVLAVASNSLFRTYYGVSSTSVPNTAITNVLDLVPTEFLLRGFLMFTLLRAIGPIGVLVAVMPFAFSHLGKPEIELFSTLFGGLAFGWLDWRTGSIAWSALAHIYILTLIGAAVALG